jgi:hypothetical protein
LTRFFFSFHLSSSFWHHKFGNKKTLLLLLLISQCNLSTIFVFLTIVATFSTSQRFPQIFFGFWLFFVGSAFCQKNGNFFLGF